MEAVKSRRKAGDESDAERQTGVPGRRAFLIGTGAALLGAAAAGRSEAAASPKAAPRDRTTLSYRETDHVRRFYACARF